MTENKLNVTKTPFTSGPQILICNREALIAVTHRYNAQLRVWSETQSDMVHVAQVIMYITHSLFAKSQS